MAKILILIGAHLCTAPRPQKEAETLAAAGHEVTVQGVWYDPLYAERDRVLTSDRRWQFRPIIDFRPGSLRRCVRGLGVRARHRGAREMQMRFGKFAPSVLAYGARSMLASALVEKADLTIVHSEAGLWVGAHLLDSGLRVGVDYEDWFSEDLLPEARRSRPVAQLKMFERRLLRECEYRVTTSNVLSAALSEAYDATKPSVVYNTFPFAERADVDGRTEDRRNLLIPSLHWFSQTIGPGRGLEQFFKSLQHVTHPAEVHLRGDCSNEARRWIASLLPIGWEDRVFVHQTVANAELLSRVCEHDVGLALEIPYCPNKQLTISNKIFQYLQAGLAVVATDTHGQREVFTQCPDVGHVVTANDPRALADAITSLISDKNRLSAAKHAALRAAGEVFSWERQAEVLSGAADRALQKPSANVMKV